MSLRSFHLICRSLALMIVFGLALTGCGPQTHQPAVPANVYEGAKEAFKAGDLDKAVDLTEKLANASPPAEGTDHARVLRTVIYAGQLKGYSELADAYAKGAEKARISRFQAEYHRLENEALANAGKAALYLAETAHQFNPGGLIANQMVLDANYPAVEGPVAIPELARVEEGGWIEPDQQATAATEALREGVDDVLGEMVSGDRAKARQALAAGPVQIDGSAFALFLAAQLAQGAAAFDRHHGRDPQKLLILCDEADACLKTALTLLKTAPDQTRQKEAQKLKAKLASLRQDR